MSAVSSMFSESIPTSAGPASTSLLQAAAVKYGLALKYRSVPQWREKSVRSKTAVPRRSVSGTASGPIARPMPVTSARTTGRSARRVDVGSRVATQVQRGDEEFRLALVARGVIVVEDFDARRRQRPVRFHPLDDRVAHLDEPPHSGSLATGRTDSIRVALTNDAVPDVRHRW